jgi:hypothetical protein
MKWSLSNDYAGIAPFCFIAIYVGRHPITNSQNLHVALLGLHLFVEFGRGASSENGLHSDS